MISRRKKSKAKIQPWVKRIIVIAFFLGLNIALGMYFIQNNKFHLPTKLTNILTQTGLIEKEKLNYFTDKFVEKVDPSLDPQVIFTKLNSERLLFEIDELDYNNSLASAAAILLSEAKQYDYDLENKDFLTELKNALDKVGYDYLHVSHNMVLGPLTEKAIVDSWFSDPQQVEALKNNDFVEVGFATKIVELDDLGTVGVVVQVLGKPKISTKVVPQQIVSNKPVYPDISNEEVLKALNDYRLSHGVQTLNVDDNLCTYASKRVQDLIAFGGLDNHEGFKKDFEDQENLPEPIQNYSGNLIAENLAHQHCKNMTTGDAFIAQTGTAIIEWCFDSSTKGHREAQLNNNFDSACVRNGEYMYVIIFGN